MSNLSIENLNHFVQTGDTEGFMGMPGTALTQPGVSSEKRVLQEMQTQGLQAPSEAHQAGATFSQLLRDSMDKVNEAQAQADTAIKELVAGRNKNIHETMLTIEKADTSLKLMMQVRNKVLDAYREIMRMQV